MFNVSKEFNNKYPDAHAGVMILRDVQNLAAHPELDARKRLIEAELRSRFGASNPQTLAATPPLPAYTAYYKHFDKTYHVLGQLNSIIYKEKPIPTVATLVEAMFMAELKNGLLTAGHDSDQIRYPVSLNIAAGDEHYMVMRGVDQTLKAEDMYISDQIGILSSIIYGPDQRTQITADTKNVLYTVYAPQGIACPAVEDHLNEILELVKIFSPGVKVELLKVYGADIEL